ncbi:MAG TPA: hypothetical protein VHE30_11240 [Polyangiaceae bacterium]|nr:hypothetical protein [Polyangiaceae bacterium]
MTARAPVDVEVVEIERISGRGTAKTVWVVKLRDAWVRAGNYPGATTTRLDTGSGTVWEHSISLRLEPGTELERVESRPKEPERKDPLAYLEGGTKRAVVTRRTRYVVSPNGRLTPRK